MRFLAYCTLLIFFLSIQVSCKKNKDEDKLSPDNVSLSSSGFTHRIDYFWNKIDPFGKSANDSIVFYHIADVASPIVHGIACSATGMEIVDHLCYVTYHVAGATYGGAIEVFDISTPSNPTLVSQLIFEDAGFNECTVANGKLYAVGGRNVYSSNFTANDTKGGVLVEINLVNGMLSTDLRWAALPSFSGNSVNSVGNYLFVTSGSTGGGVFTLEESSLDLVQADYFTNAKFLDVRNNQLGEKTIALQGYPEAILHEYTAGIDNVSGKQTHNILSQNVPYNGKAVVHIDNSDVFVCTGANGLLGFHMNNLTAPFIEFESPGNGNANGVHTDNEFIYVANGQEGVIIINKDNLAIHSIFEYAGSANYVKANGRYVFISHGKGGVKILRRADPLPEDNGCEDRPEIHPSTINGTFVINLGLQLTYRGSNTINGEFTNFGEFYYCGDLTILRKTVLNHGSTTYITGSLRVKDLFINPGAKLIIDGDLIVEGDLHLRGEIEFIGDNNTVTVNGNVIIGNDSVVTGSYTSNKPLE